MDIFVQLDLSYFFGDIFFDGFFSIEVSDYAFALVRSDDLIDRIQGYKTANKPIIFSLVHFLFRYQYFNTPFTFTPQTISLLSFAVIEVDLTHKQKA